jgi:hypothetical protein
MTTLAIKPTDQEVTNSTTLRDDSDRSLPLEADSQYVVDLMLVYDTAKAGDIQWRLMAPDGATFTGSPAAGPASTSDGTSDGDGDALVTGWRGVLSTSTAGSLTLQWAQYAAYGTTTVHAGSYLRAVAA